MRFADTIRFCEDVQLLTPDIEGANIGIRNDVFPLLGAFKSSKSWKCQWLDTNYPQ